MSSVVVVDDTPVGIRAGRNAGAFTIGVSQTGNELGLSFEGASLLPPLELEQRLAEAAAKLYNAGAQLVIRSAAELADVIGE